MTDHSILGQVALAYSPVIDRNRAVAATRLTVFPLQYGTHIPASSLLDVVAQVWPQGGSEVWLNVLSESLLQDIIAAQPASHVVVEVPAFMACDPECTDALVALHANGNALLLKGRPLSELPRNVLPCFKYSIIDLQDDRRVDPTTGTELNVPQGVIRSIPHCQSGVTHVEDMEASFRRGAISVLGWPIDNAIETSSRSAEQPALQLIVQLIDQVNKGADIDDLENIIKRDPPLAYKLMRYINSPAFGLSVEISSFRHAIMILGYQRLKRWLALLLATASKDPNMRPVMYAAVRRGLLMEELARMHGDDEMRSELFICGVFSLLDRMFRLPFGELLKTIPVPERVFQVLVDGSGPYAPYVNLVKAIEGQTLQEIRDGADGLLMPFSEINLALLRALGSASQLD